MAQRSRQVADERRRLRALRRALAGQERRVAERRDPRRRCADWDARPAAGGSRVYLARDGEVDLAALIRAARRGGARSTRRTSPASVAARCVSFRSRRRPGAQAQLVRHRRAGARNRRSESRRVASTSSWPLVGFDRMATARHGGGLLRPRASAAARRRRRVATAAARRRRLRLPGDRHDRGGALGRAARPGRDGARRLATATRIRPTHGVNVSEVLALQVRTPTFGIDHLARAQKRHHRLGRRAQLPGAQHAAGRDAEGRSRLSSITRAATCRVSPASSRWCARVIPSRRVRSEECLLRSGQRSEAAALVQVDVRSSGASTRRSRSKPCANMRIGASRTW